ncbi:crossover junction endodeoxyribonuclease RuvC [Prochlorococcus marinus]|uniref:crossover junction endodeoxyribonuclease RuvC n=1 Tax=Prochlorococcus marinus TaxID=1219 RepID=UPI0022B517A9|nr:crossover junction endodeoxyribonuclease RuvC [Prochlorococcus marinus]
MRIIGIDPGLARVGYGIIDEIEGKKIMIDCGIIETKSTQKEEERLVEISNDLSSIIKKWNPNSAAVEKFFFYRSSTTISVVQARGVIMMTLGKYKLPIQEFPPMQIKLAVTGHGHSDKNEVLNSVMHELNVTSPPKPDDAADALAIALTGIYLK